MAQQRKSKISKDVKGIKFTTPIGIAAFPRLFTPEPYEKGGKAYYQLTMLFPKDTDLKAMQTHILNAGKEAFGDDPKKWPKGNQGEKVSLPWRDGDKKQDLAGYPGHYYVSGKTEHKPTVVKYVNKDKQRVPVENEDEIHGGNIGRAVFLAKATESGGRYYVSLYLQGFQKLKEGERFGGANVTDDDFEDVDLGEDDESNYEGFEVEESDSDDDDGYDLP